MNSVCVGWGKLLHAVHGVVWQGTQDRCLPSWTSTLSCQHSTELRTSSIKTQAEHSKCGMQC